MTESKPLRAPTGLKSAGRKLWLGVVAEFDLETSELAVLEQACRMRDRIAALDKLVVTEGEMLASSQGARLHPAIAEARQQRAVLGRLLTQLKLPDSETPPAGGRQRGRR